MGAYENPLSDLCNLIPTGCIQDYIIQFDILLNKANNSQANAKSIFLGGLRDQIQHTARMFHLQKLHEAYVLARLQEATFNSLGGHPV